MSFILQAIVTKLVCSKVHVYTEVCGGIDYKKRTVQRTTQIEHLELLLYNNKYFIFQTCIRQNEFKTLISDKHFINILLLPLKAILWKVCVNFL